MIEILRNLARRKVRSAITVSGIVIGIFALTTMGALSEHFNALLDLVFNENRDIKLEGLFYQGNLVAVMCEDGLCCAFREENRCNRGKGIDPEDGRKLTLNIAVYALTH